MKLKRKVLVVEDNPDDVAMLRRYLARDTEHDNVVLTSGSVDEGLHLAEAEQPDLCIVDQRLRGGNGLDLLRGLRDRNCQHAIVFLSGKSGPAQHSPSSALALGADDYLVKDEISGPQLLRALNNAVVKGQLRRELVRSQAQMERHSARVMRIQEMASELTKATSPKQVENAFCQYGPRLPSVYAGALYQAQGGTLRLRASFGAEATLWNQVKTLPVGVDLALTRALNTGAQVEEASSLSAEKVELFSQLARDEGVLCVWPLLSGPSASGVVALWVERSDDVRRVSAPFDSFIALFGQALERTKASARLRNRLDFERRLMGVVGHDLRSPLSAINNVVELLRTDAGLADTSREALDSLQHSVDHMATMIFQLLDLTRIRNEERFPLNRAQVDLAEVVESTLAQLRRVHPQRCIELHSAVPFRGYFDASALSQVLTNLVNNAVHHGSADHPVALRVFEQEGQGAIEVLNHGPAIPDALLPTLFEPFQRGRESTKKKGFGLGLYIAREIAIAHGGDITVQSRDGRTAFTVRLPPRAS